MKCPMRVRTINNYSFGSGQLLGTDQFLLPCDPECAWYRKSEDGFEVCALCIMQLKPVLITKE